MGDNQLLTVATEPSLFAHLKQGGSLCAYVILEIPKLNAPLSDIPVLKMYTRMHLVQEELKARGLFSLHVYRRMRMKRSGLSTLGLRRWWSVYSWGVCHQNNKQTVLFIWNWYVPIQHLWALWEMVRSLVPEFMPSIKGIRGMFGENRTITTINERALTFSLCYGHDNFGSIRGLRDNSYSCHTHSAWI